MELRTPLVPEDFSPGDRVYFTYLGGFNKGTVLSLDEENIIVKTDDGQTGGIPISEFYPTDGSTEYWGRLPNLELFEEGTVISRLAGDGTRHYSKIFSHTPGVSITIEAQTSRTLRTFTQNSVSDLELIFKDCEVED